MGTRESPNLPTIAEMPVMFCWMNPKLLGCTNEESAAIARGEKSPRLEALHGLAGLMFNRFVNMDVTNCLGHPARAS